MATPALRDACLALMTGRGRGVALAGKVELPVLELLVAHDVLPNYYNYVGKTKILINDNFFVVSASQLIKSITHNATGERRRRELERERGGGKGTGSKCCQGNFVIKVYNAMRRMAPVRCWSRLQHKYVNRYPN